MPNTLGAGTIVAMGGFDESVSLTLHVDMEQFTTIDSTLITMDSTLYTMDEGHTRPVSGRTLIYRGKTMRILRTSVTPDAASVAIFCGDVNA